MPTASACSSTSGPIEGKTDATFPITSSTTITWMYNDKNGNTATQKQMVVITPLTESDVAFNVENDNDPVIMISGTTFPVTVTSFEWDFGDGSPPNTTDQNPTHTYTASGEYTITLTVTCETSIDKTAMVTISGILGLTGQEGISIYPNPVTRYLNMSFNQKTTALVLDLSGKEVFRTIKAGKAHQLDFSGVDAGQYILHVYDRDGKLLGAEKVLKAE